MITTAPLRSRRVIAAADAIGDILAADPAVLAGKSAAEVWRLYCRLTREPVHLDTFTNLLKAEPQLWEQLRHSSAGRVPRTRPCRQCGVRIGPRAARFCSAACYHAWERRSHAERLRQEVTDA